MRHQVAFSTTLFPMEEKFVEAFFMSLSVQSFKNFDLVILNDGYGCLDKYRMIYPHLNIVELNYSGTPALNRQFCLNYIKNAGYSKIVFGDSDDTFSEYRIELAVELLDKVDVVVNDVNLFNDDGIFETAYMSNRVEDNAIVRSDFILDKNIFGLSNTAINADVISQTNLNFDENLIAVDWHFFAVLLQQGCSAMFTVQQQTNYRQHTVNTVGLGAFSGSHVKRLLTVRQKHYQLLANTNRVYATLLAQTEEHLVLVEDKEYLSELVSRNNNTLTFPLWWECEF